jgi:hypothetical protein
MKQPVLRSLTLSALALLTLVPQDVHAKKPHGKTGFELGPRLGVGMPLGELTDEANEDMDTLVRSQIPLWVDVGYRATPLVFAGGYLSFGPAFYPDDAGTCNASGVDCSLYSLRMGVEGLFHLQPKAEADPWLGVNIGYEALSLLQDGPRRDATLTYSGWELGVQGGLDFAVTKFFGLGPFVALAVGQYTNVTTTCDGSACRGVDAHSESIDEIGLHQWLMAGARGTFGVW